MRNIFLRSLLSIASLTIWQSVTQKSNGSERSRGWLPEALTLDGMKQMIDTAESLEDVEDVKSLYSSDLLRSVQSAEELAHVLVIPVEPREDLRDWNVGDYAGQEIKDILKDLHGYMDDPNKVIPGGSPSNSS